MASWKHIKYLPTYKLKISLSNYLATSSLLLLLVSPLKMNQFPGTLTLLFSSKVCMHSSAKIGVGDIGEETDYWHRKTHSCCVINCLYWPNNFISRGWELSCSDQKTRPGRTELNKVQLGFRNFPVHSGPDSNQSK